MPQKVIGIEYDVERMRCVVIRIVRSVAVRDASSEGKQSMFGDAELVDEPIALKKTV